MKSPTRSGTSILLECACGLILRQGHVLLGFRTADRKTYPNVWDVFGGHVEDGETIEEALVRELREELNITPTEFTYLESLNKNLPEKNAIYTYHFFRVTAWSGNGPSLVGTEHSQIGWHTLAEALALNLALSEYRDLFTSNINQ